MKWLQTQDSENSKDNENAVAHLWNSFCGLSEFAVRIRLCDHHAQTKNNGDDQVELVEKLICSDESDEEN